MTNVPSRDVVARSDVAAAPPGPRRRLPTGMLVAVAIVALAGLTAAGWQSGAASTWRSPGDSVKFEVYERESGNVVFSRGVDIGDSFELRHRHSVTSRHVLETFSVASAHEISLDELWFDEHGANLPAGPDMLGPDTTFLVEDGAYRVLHHDQIMKTVPIAVGSESVDHTVRFSDGVHLRLLDVTRAGAAVELRVSK